MINRVPSHQVKDEYQGHRSLQVPVRMYSRNTLLGAMHMSSSKFLGVELDRYVLTFHSEAAPGVSNSEEEVPFSHIKSIETDISKAENDKYYLKVNTEEGELKFKFKNPRDFHSVVEVLKNILHHDKCLSPASDAFRAAAQDFNQLPLAEANPYLNASISSDDHEEFHTADKIENNASKLQKDVSNSEYSLKKNIIESNNDLFVSQKKQELKLTKELKDDLKNYNKDIKKDVIGLQKDKFKLNEELIKESHYDGSLNKDFEKVHFKQNKERINSEYGLQKERIHQEYEVNKDIDREIAKEKRDVNIEASKDLCEANLAFNKDHHKAAKVVIKNLERLDKHQAEYTQDRNEALYEQAKSRVKHEYIEAQKDLDTDFCLHKDVNKAERDFADELKKADLSATKADLEVDIRDAKNVRY